MTIKNQGYKRVLTRLIGILLVCGLLLTGCATTKPAPPTLPSAPLFVPQKADLIGKIELASIRDDKDFINLYEEIAAQNTHLPRTWSAALNEVQHETGVDPRDFSEAIVFADASTLIEAMTSPQGSIPYCGALVTGNLNEKTFIYNVETKMNLKFETISYKNYRIYTYVDPHTKVEVFSIVFPGEGQMVIGSVEAVEDVINCMTHEEEPISGTVYDLYSQLGDALIKVASSIPSSLTQQIPAELPAGPINIDLRSFRDIDYATLTLAKNEAIINANVCLEFNNEDSAKRSELMLWAFTKFGKYVVPDPEVKELLGKIHLARSNSSVSITYAMPISEIEPLILALLSNDKSSKHLLGCVSSYYSMAVPQF